MDREKVIKGLEHCTSHDDGRDKFGGVGKCGGCPYYGHDCTDRMKKDALALLKEQKAEHRRLLSWLGKFCRHIDNGDAWLTDEENIAFFKEKMKQQFGWNTD